ncbi:yml6 [Candida theae]|uniref:Large ribosomal subunit protein uL4m n=1 Tax=Candida theae TaxID=1198502 RepID=A0AAD5FXS4_9ASCO|nr:yml6 [Candida theae]KAI5955969.1 yml6 [Candida theae]
MFKQSIRRLATEAKTQSAPVSQAPSSLHVAPPPKYTLAQLRTFPSLEPTTFVPLPTSFFNTHSPTRRDLLWSAAVFEADRARVGSNYVTLKSDSPYSNRKLRPQKGSGRARLGDANSPHMDNEIKAHAIKGPHDWSTDLPAKIYSKAVQTALTSQYKSGHLFVIDKECDFAQGSAEITQSFVSSHKLNQLNILFITEEDRNKLSSSLDQFFLNDRELKKMSRKERAKAVAKVKGKVIKKEDVEVRDILKANRVFVELSALQWLISKYSV